MTDDAQREAFEKWYAENAFNYERDPIGSRECGLQWTAWQAALASQADVARDAMPDDDERKLLAVIDERDRRDDIIDQLCDAVLGPDRAEWSSAYGFDNAVDDVRDAVESLARNAGRWRAVCSNTGNGLRVIQWNPAAIEELQVMFPSPVLCDEEADAMAAQRGEAGRG